MAIVIRGKSKCSLCGQVISNTHDITSFPAFVPKNHRFWKYSDAAFHKDCFYKLDQVNEIIDYYNKVKELNDERPKIPEGVKDFDFWYNSSLEVKEWQKRIYDFYKENG